MALLPYSLRQGSQSNPELADVARLANLLDLGILCDNLLGLKLQVGFHTHPELSSVFEILNRHPHVYVPMALAADLPPHPHASYGFVGHLFPSLKLQRPIEFLRVWLEQQGGGGG